MKLERGELYVRDSDTLTAYRLEDGEARPAGPAAQKLPGQEDLGQLDSEEAGAADLYQPPAAPIDPAKVTIRHLEMYEELMKG